MTPSNIKVGFRATWIWPLNNSAIANRMQLSEGFISRSLEVSITEILEEEVTSPTEDLIHYYVGVEGSDEENLPLGKGQHVQPRHYSKFLRLPQ